MNHLEDAYHYENKRYILEGNQTCARLLRNYAIREAFKSGVRQKEIANKLGMSESTVKHIIAEQKKLV